MELPPTHDLLAGRHIVLVGLPGSGKSAVGRAAAARLVRPFLDFDVELERRTGASVAQLFATRGEAGFRELELELTRELRSGAPMVLAPGGGWVTNPVAVGLLSPPATLVHLRVSPEVAMARMGGSLADRPLLRVADPLAELRRLAAARAVHYAVADVVLNVDVLGIQDVTELVVRVAHDGGSG